MSEKISDKIFHHVAFTLFWLLLIAVIVISIIRIIQWDNGMVKECIDRGYSEEMCRGL
jgi:hypothetical protein